MTQPEPNKRKIAFLVKERTASTESQKSFRGVKDKIAKRKNNSSRKMSTIENPNPARR